jgi:N6-adenosine-specific RNA methylase IME4
LTILAQYDAARAALAKCKTADVPIALRLEMEHVKLHARQVQDKALMADATEIQMRAERRLGEILHEAESEGLISVGRPKKRSVENGSASEPFTLAEAGISKKLSAKSQQFATIAEPAFEAMVEHTRKRIAAGAPTIIDKEATNTQKKERRANRERVLGECIAALPTAKYGLIVADPEWQFEPRSRETGMDRAADNHYPTSCTQVIAARDVPSIAANDCVLFLWATAPMLAHALLVMAAWGFDYKTHLIWHKIRNGAGRGSGYWATGEHEPLLIGTRGKVVAPATAMCGSVIAAPWQGKHSAKPEIFLEIIEREFPNTPKIELNRRGPPRPGWDAWGNQVESPLPTINLSSLPSEHLAFVHVEETSVGGFVSG